MKPKFPSAMHRLCACAFLLNAADITNTYYADIKSCDDIWTDSPYEDIRYNVVWIETYVEWKKINCRDPRNTYRRDQYPWIGIRDKYIQSATRKRNTWI